MSPFVLIICLLGHCQYIDMPSLQACKRAMAQAEDTMESQEGTALCIDRRRSEDPNER
jgi:hypothetical protein